MYILYYLFNAIIKNFTFNKNYKLKKYRVLLKNLKHIK